MTAAGDSRGLQLTNHGVDEAVVQRMKDSTVQFFSLPLEDKAAVAVRGIGFEGFGHHYSSASSGNKLDWAESVILRTQPLKARSMQFWPTNPPTFRQALGSYSVAMIDLAMRLLSFMADDLGVEREALLDAFTGKVQSMAFHHYPPCRQPEKVLGIVPHTDGLGLTLLLHADDTPGLQIRKGGRWFPVPPLPGAFVVNVADILEVLTNGAYPSVQHRVIPDAERGRTTVVVFQEASVGGTVAPLPELVKGGEAAARYRSIEMEEYTMGNLNALAVADGTRDEITDAAASAFANSGGQQIPEKYIRTKEVLNGVVVGEEESYELPVVDMARLLDPELSASEVQKLGDACRTWGFFQLTNHGVDEAVVQRMKDDTVQFFRLPLQSKTEVAVRERGFEGFGHHYSRASSGKLDWAESVILATQPPQDRNMELWPTNPPTFRNTLDSYSVEMIGLAVRLLGFMAADLGVEREALLDAFSGKRQGMTIHYYPPCRHREKVMGITPHTDWLGLTLLLHCDDTPGLQIRKDGRWFPVRPLPGAFVVNVADILEVLTNGAYESVQHRVIPDAERGRTTVVVFQEAFVGGMVAPLPELVNGGEARYRSIEMEEYTMGNLNALAVADGTRDEITDAAASAFANSGQQIPDKYIQTEEVLDGVVVGEDESYELPVVDMARLLDPELSASEIRKLGDACRNWGFFQLTNHGADEAVVQRMKDDTVQFFGLPLQSKRAVAVRGEKGFEGFGHHYSRASSGKLDWAESVILITQPTQDRNMELWPTNPPTFRSGLSSICLDRPCSSSSSHNMPLGALILPSLPMDYILLLLGTRLTAIQWR
ncbi:hypothetical protein U9M48_007775 [Paspalum notatum var. saurae]|uniref:Fe2OG dioxygenase domain-containing protein n=1 Tax=Paspalum notatum var. saurae TaxID=547442 RepID=A0AAQ3SNP5_PASNO